MKELEERKVAYPSVRFFMKESVILFILSVAMLFGCFYEPTADMFMTSYIWVGGIMGTLLATIGFSFAFVKEMYLS